MNIFFLRVFYSRKITRFTRIRKNLVPRNVSEGSVRDLSVRDVDVEKRGTTQRDLFENVITNTFTLRKIQVLKILTIAYEKITKRITFIS